MEERFEMSDLGLLSYYLGIEVTQEEGYVELRQAAYVKKVLEKAGMSKCNPMKYSMDPKLVISRDDGGKAVNSTEYKCMLGGLRYLVHTRPDIAYIIGIISRFMKRPMTLHLNAVNGFYATSKVLYILV